MDGQENLNLEGAPSEVSSAPTPRVASEVDVQFLKAKGYEIESVERAQEFLSAMSDEDYEGYLLDRALGLVESSPDEPNSPIAPSPAVETALAPSPAPPVQQKPIVNRVGTCPHCASPATTFAGGKKHCNMCGKGF